MGIRGLKSYVNSLPFGGGQVWESSDLRNTNLVIDGCGLYFHIYESNKLNCKFGGQYNELQTKVKKFFEKLLKHKVVPYVVFDGIAERNEKKSATYEKRENEKIERIKKLWASRNPDYEMVRPPLTKLAVMHALQELNKEMEEQEIQDQVHYAVADFEADCEIASLANQLDASVLGNDSDFYIFNIKHGYIPFKDYDFEGSKTAVRKFSFIAFAEHLGLHVSRLPLLASLAGNDYISDEMLKPFHDHIGKGDKFKNIAQFLSKYTLDSEAKTAVINLFPNDHKASFRKALDLSIEEYQEKQSNLIDCFDSAFSGVLRCNMLTYNGHPLPQWVVKLYRQGLIASEGLNCLCNRKIFLGTQSEDLKLPSAQKCAQGLRRHYYKLALDCEGTSNTASTSQATTEDIVVTENDREKSKRVEHVVNLPKINVQIHDIPQMPDQNRNSHILDFLDSNVPSIRKLPHEHQMVAAAMRYWVIHSQIKPEHLAALLVHYVGENCSLKEYLKISSEAVHGFAQWQNVLYWAERLNTLFSSTFPQPQVAKLYDGIRVCKVYEKLQDSKGVTSVESIVTNKGDYHLLYNAITEGLPADRQFNQSPSRETEQNKEDMTLEKEKTTKSKSSEVLKENPFGPLGSSSSDEN